MRIIRTIIFAVGLATSVSACAAARNSVLEMPNKDAIGCLVANPIVIDQLKSMGLKQNQIALVSYHVGPIGNVIPQQKLIAIVIYSTDGNHGRLYFVDTENEKYQVVENGYTLAKAGTHWDAGEGNGGYATYEEIGDFVTRLSKKRKFKAQLTPLTANCMN